MYSPKEVSKIKEDYERKMINLRKNKTLIEYSYRET